jgi:hypothetical protein
MDTDWPVCGAPSPLVHTIVSLSTQVAMSPQPRVMAEELVHASCLAQ